MSRSIHIAGWLGLALLVGVPAKGRSQEQTGYRLARTQVVVDRPEHWQAWEAAIGSDVISQDGAVQPRFLRRGTDAVLDAGQFEVVDVGGEIKIGGIRQVGSDTLAAPRVMDGDLGTWWEPSRQDSLERWFLEIDLGRSVIADQVVVRFAPEGQGDPFLKFRVLVSDGREGIGQYQGLTFFRVGQVTWLNKDQREFRFAVLPQHALPEGMSGGVVQVVRFEALETDGPHGEELDAPAYQTLAPDDRGAIDHYRQLPSGRAILVDEQTYQDLPEAEKGPVRYYRHERPRLAELEVHCLGDNVVTLTQRLRNRDLNLFANILLALTTDGFFRSSYVLRPYDALKDKNQLQIDLGAKFWLDRIRLLSADHPMSAYQIRIADGSLNPTGGLVWKAFDERQNQNSYLQVEERFPLQEVRFIEVRRLEVVGSVNEQGNLSEVQGYGEGYVSEVTLTSPLIRLDRSRIFTTVNWEGEAPADTRLEVRTRSGNELRAVEQYYNVAGQRVSKEEWGALPERNRGERTLADAPGADWSDWSEVYQVSGESFRSPSPRQYALVQVRLLTRHPLRAAAIEGLWLDLAAPLADQVLGEVWPMEGIRPGVDQEFALYLRPQFRSGDSGFDRLHLYSPSSAPIELISLAAGTETQIRLGYGEQWWPGKVEVMPSETGDITLSFPEPVTRGNLVYAVKFRTQVFLSSTTFTAELQRTTRPGIVQAVTQGDVASEVPSQSLTVIADLQNAPLLDEVQVMPSIFTPNGDGVNDEAQVEFAVFRLNRGRLLEIAVYDLEGRRVRNLSSWQDHPSGEHVVVWDGRGEDGRLVQPGIFLVRVRLEADEKSRTSEAVKVVHVVY